MTYGYFLTRLIVYDKGKFSQFLTPTPLPSAFQQKAYEGDFLSLCTVTFGPLAHVDTPPSLRNADILNEWSLKPNLSQYINLNIGA